MRNLDINHILNLIGPKICEKNTKFKSAIPFVKHLAVFYANQLISKHSGMHTATARISVDQDLVFTNTL